MKRLALAVVMAGLSAAAAADNNNMEHPYLGIDYMRGEFKDDANNVTANPAAIRLRAGTELDPMLGVEAHAALGVADDKITLPGVTYDVKIRGVYGLFLRPQLSLGKTASIYALAGYSYVQVAAGSSNTAAPSSHGYDNSFSYGGGADLAVYNGIRVEADFVRYISGFNAISAGIRIPLD